ncbi:hypothetical protein DKX15_15890, partial [Enterococcus faecium]
RQVQCDEQVHEVSLHPTVDDVLGEGERRQIGQHGVEVGAEIGDCAQGRFQVAQVPDEVLLRIVDQPGGGVAESP